MKHKNFILTLLVLLTVLASSTVSFASNQYDSNNRNKHINNKHNNYNSQQRNRHRNYGNRHRDSHNNINRQQTIPFSSPYRNGDYRRHNYSNRGHHRNNHYNNSHRYRHYNHHYSNNHYNNYQPYYQSSYQYQPLRGLGHYFTRNGFGFGHWHNSTWCATVHSQSFYHNYYSNYPYQNGWQYGDGDYGISFSFNY